MAAVLVATLGDGRGHEALLAARHAQEQQLAGSWAADHKGMMRLAALHKLWAKQSLATKAPGDQSSDDDESGAGDVKETVANKLFGAEAGSGGNAAAPPYEVEEDSDVGEFSTAAVPPYTLHVLVRAGVRCFSFQEVGDARCAWLRFWFYSVGAHARWDGG